MAMAAPGPGSGSAFPTRTPLWCRGGVCMLRCDVWLERVFWEVKPSWVSNRSRSYEGRAEGGMVDLGKSGNVPVLKRLREVCFVCGSRWRLGRRRVGA